MKISRKDFIVTAFGGAAISIVPAEYVDTIKSDNRVNSFICKYCDFDIIPKFVNIEKNEFDERMKRTSVMIQCVPGDMKVYEGYWETPKDEHEDPWVSFSMNGLMYTPKQSHIFEYPSLLYIDYINKVHISTKVRLSDSLRRQYDNRQISFHFYYLDEDKEHQRILKSLREFKEYHKI